MKISIKRGITTFGLFFFLAMLPMSCGLLCRDSCGCKPLPQPREFMIQSFATKTIDGAGRGIPETQSGNYDQIFKSIQIKDIEFTAKVRVEGPDPWNFGLAFACDPAPDTSKNELQQIEIINEREFTLADGTQYLVGENLTSLFGINRVFSTEIVPIGEFAGLGRKLTFDDFLKIGLLENPGRELQLEFTIRLVFDDGQEFLITNQILNFR